MRIVLLIISIFFLNPTEFIAQTDSIQQEKTIHYDKREQLSPVKFDEQRLENYRKSDAFDYTRKKEEISWWEQFKRWLSHIWQSFWQWLFGNYKAGSFVAFLVKYLPYLIIALLIGFVVWLFIRLNPGANFLNTKNKGEVFLSEEEKIIEREDIEALINKALNDKNYRLAVRYYYLNTLKYLKDYNIIDYQYQKTNHDYAIEINTEELRKQFNKITYLYDFIWYGDFKVNHHDYHIAEKEFKTIQLQIKNTTHE